MLDTLFFYFYILIFTCVTFVSMFITKHMDLLAKKKVTQEQPLFDFGHSILPDTSKYRIINDIIPNVLMGFAFLFHTNAQLNKLAISLIIALSIRMVTVYSTILPATDKSCKLNKFTGGCHDKVFSGHMTFALMTSIFLAKHNPQYIPYLIPLMLFLATSIISSRDHYTVDVLIAVVITTLISKIYLTDKV